MKPRHLSEVFEDDYKFIGPLIYKYHMKLKRFDKELYSKCLGQQHVQLVELVNFREFFLKLDDFIYNCDVNQSVKIENNFRIDLAIRIYQNLFIKEKFVKYLYEKDEQVTQDQVDNFFSVWNQSTFIDQLDFKKKSQKKPLLFESTRDPPEEEFYDKIDPSIKVLQKGFTAYKFNYTNNQVKKVHL